MLVTGPTGETGGGGEWRFKPLSAAAAFRRTLLDAGANKDAKIACSQKRARQLAKTPSIAAIIDAHHSAAVVTAVLVVTGAVPVSSS